MRLLEQVIDRDGPACVWCGRELWREDLTLEHLLPRSRGGRTIAENLVVACRACNRRRRTRPVSAYIRVLHAPGAQGAPIAPRIDLIATALHRLANSDLARHAEYGRRQLALLDRDRARVQAARA
jgi:hypothetical protein